MGKELTSTGTSFLIQRTHEYTQNTHTHTDTHIHTHTHLVTHLRIAHSSPELQAAISNLSHQPTCLQFRHGSQFSDIMTLNE